MSSHGFAPFDTPIGHCGMAWREDLIVGVHLPESTEAETRSRLRRRFPDLRETTPPPDIQQAIDRIVGLLRGQHDDLVSVPLDMDAVPDFDRAVYEVARTIPPGQTLTYGEIAKRIGAPREARRVGQALGRNPFAPVVPCHRVVAAGGKLGGFSANGSVVTKLRMLAIEGAPTNGTLPLFDEALANTAPSRCRLASL
jgi:methylated-DNA-[protein]-cysteine S-methyltransferase